MAESETVEVEVKALHRGSFAFIRGQPCKVTEVTQKPKATSKGNDRIHLVGLNLQTGKKYEDTLLATLRIDEIVVKRSEYSLLDVDTHSDTVSVLMSSGETKEDLVLEKSENPNEKYSPLSQELVDRFDAGEDLIVVVQSALGNETIIEIKAGENQ
eukprot:GFUD01036931.1.p1 GENE.GFUD01036931.1~~GFUD01036931.1.p1  ORF type:complete len:156 (+),score=39.63 GFUD01036931.1:57-524(+)